MARIDNRFEKGLTKVTNYSLRDDGGVGLLIEVGVKINIAGKKVSDKRLILLIHLIKALKVSFWSILWWI